MVLFFLAAAHAEDWPTMTNAEGASIAWTSSPVAFVINPSNEEGIAEADAVAAIKASADPWGQVEGVDFSFDYQGRSGAAVSGVDEVNVVWFQSSDWGTGDDKRLAEALLSSTDDGTAVQFDIRINGEDHNWAVDGSPDKIDLQNAITHEFGHAAGLGHITDDLAATMYPSAPAGETDKRDLTDSDKSALSWIYTGQEYIPTPLGCADLAAEMIAPRSNVRAALLPALLGFALWRRRSPLSPR